MSAPTRELTHRQEAAKLTLKQVAMPWAMYIRVSTKDQGEKYSPASQRRTLLRLADDLGVTVPERFILEDMKSGRNDDRPDYQRLRELATTKQIGGVLVLELSRVGRNVVDSLAFRSMLKREGVAAAFALQQFDDSPQGKFMWIQFAAVGELEVDMILQRTSKGRLEKALKGELSDPHTFGYVYHPSERLKGGKVQEGYVEQHADEARIVREMIFEAYAKHGSSYRIQMALNEAGITTKRGNPFVLQGVLKMMRNRMYTGKFTKTIKGEDLKPVVVEMDKPELAIISQALFDKVQVMLAKHADRAGRTPTENLLSGFLRCACTLPSGKRCFRKYIMNNKCSFVCTNRYNQLRPKDDRCQSHGVSRKRIERCVLDDVRNSLRSPENTYRMARVHHLAMLRDASKGKSAGATVEAKLARLEVKYKRTEAILFADVPQRTRDNAAQQLRELDETRRALEVEAREAAVDAVVTLPAQDAVAETFKRIQKGIDGLKTFDEHREFLSSTVQHIETDGSSYTIFCRVRLDGASVRKGGKNTQLHHNVVEYFSYQITGRVA